MPARAADAGVDAAGTDGGPSPAEVIATYCSATDLECTTAPLAYAKTVELPIAFDFDTGWVPSGSSLQVRFFLKIPASTTVKLDGFLETTWPEPMTLATPGGPNGLLAFDYGLELGAKAKLDVNVIGVPVKWEGDIPYVPKVDFHLKAEKKFPSWAFAPNVATATGSSEKLRVLEVNLLDLAGIPSQISKGGVAVDVKGGLTATYQTERIRIEPAKVTDQHILSQEGTTTRAFAGGAFVEYDVFPEGRVDYTGTLHVIPTFFVSVLGKDFDLPVVDLPISFDVGKQDFVFDPVRVHVPLPDFEPVVAVLDFGSVNVGSEKTLKIGLDNVGEAQGRATGFLDDAALSSFSLPAAEVLVSASGSKDYPVSFAPKSAGKAEAVLTLLTNDPDERFLKVTLKGSAVGGGVPDGGSDGGTDDPALNDPGDTGGCGCALAADGTGSSLAVLGFALLVIRRRR
jgi:hypothetical protein